MASQISVAPSFYFDSYLEPEEAKPSQVYVNALARMERYIVEKGFPSPPPTPVDVMRRALQKVKRLSNMSSNSSTKSIDIAIRANQTSLAHLGGGWTSLKPLIRLVYLYTLEDPPVYRMVNEFLANKTMWHVDPNDSDGRYHGYSSGLNLDEEAYKALGGYAIALIQALFALHELALVNGVTDTGVVRADALWDFKETLCRGLPKEGANPFRTQGRSYKYNRWTTFCSTTTDPNVASQFGEAVFSFNRFASHQYPIFFDIGWMSEYPEESEWLMLPGVSPGVQAHRARLEYGNITAWFIRAQWKHSGYCLKNPDHPNRRPPEFQGTALHEPSCCSTWFCPPGCPGRATWRCSLIYFFILSSVIAVIYGVSAMPYIP